MTTKAWSYIAGGFTTKVMWHKQWQFGTKQNGPMIKGIVKIQFCKIEGAEYCLHKTVWIRLNFIGK